MTKKLLLVSLLIVIAASILGCETSRGMTRGAGKFVEETASGIKKDWAKAGEIDAWIQENLW